MVGFYRYILAGFVIFSHLNFSHWSLFGIPINQGVCAVFSFYIISGFFSAVIFDRFKREEGHDVLRFYVDRLLRILPLFWAVIFIISCINLVAYQPALGVTPGAYRKFSSYVYALLQPLNGLIAYFYKGDFPFGPFFPSLPVVVSLALEVQFMFILPLFVYLSTRHLLYVIALSSILTIKALIYGGPELENYTYRYVIGLLPLFLCGLLLYRQVQNSAPQRVKLEYVGVILGLVYLALLVAIRPESTEMLGELSLALITCPLILKACLKKRSGKWDHLAGYLSYGIFLTHLPILRILNLPQQSYLSMTVTLIVATALSLALHLTVERPLLRMRHRMVLQEVKTIKLS